jgi:hypothetical protein
LKIEKLKSTTLKTSKVFSVFGRTGLVRLAILTVCLLLFGPNCSNCVAGAPQSSERRFNPSNIYKESRALVIGVGDYTKGWPDLSYAPKDAREVSNKLIQMGFETKLVLNPTYDRLTAELDKFTYDWGKDYNKALLLYFAGHGETEILADGTRLGYIIPTDCPLHKRNPLQFSQKSISMKDIEVLSLKIKSRHVLMLFDSCFSGSIFSLVRAVPQDISEKSALPVRQFITAGGENESVPDKSVFKKSFLIGLDGDADLTRDGYITGSEIGMYLVDKVIQYSNRSQHPQYGKINNPALDRGDFIFVLPKQPDAIQVSSNQPTPTRIIQQEPEMETSISLRQSPLRLSGKDVDDMLVRYNFYDIHRNSRGRPSNRLMDNADGTVTDHSTDLMWQQAGSASFLTFKDAEHYIRNLNQSIYAGYSDWRLPTIEELASLITSTKSAQNLHINHIFSNTQRYCWSADKKNARNAWYATFHSGGIFWDGVYNKRYVRAVRHAMGRQ